MTRRSFSVGHTVTVSMSVLVAGGIIALATQAGFDKVAGEMRLAMDAASGQVPETASTVSFDNVSLKGVPYIGAEDAPVGMAYWFDYQCPFCREVEQKVMPRLVEQYVKPGKLRIYFKDYQFLGPDSYDAAITSRAVWEVAPQLFGAWHSALFAKQDGENAGWGDRDDVFALLDTITGLDAAKVKELVANKADEYMAAIDRDLQEGGRFGIQGTPGTVVGNRLLSGAQPIEAFQSAIDEALTKG